MQLEQLDLSHNELTSLPIELRKLISLRSLNVSHNKLVNTKDGSEGKTTSDDGKLGQFVNDNSDQCYRWSLGLRGLVVRPRSTTPRDRPVVQSTHPPAAR